MPEQLQQHRHSVSFSRHGSSGDDEDIQISLAPYIQTYLAHSSRRVSCCGVSLPIAFERAAAGSWLNPRFDSEILEGQYRASAFPQIRLRFRYALIFILLCSLLWFIYFLSSGITGNIYHWPLICVILGLLFLFILSILWLTYYDFFRVHMHKISFFIAVLLCIISLSFLSISSELVGRTDHFALSSVGHFSICVEILLIIYTVIPLPLYTSLTVCSVYSVIFEILNYFLHSDIPNNKISYIFVRILLQFSIHLLGLHILTMTVVRMRGTFMKVGQSLLVRRQLELEKQLKEQMIHSVMPPKVADWLLNETHIDDNNLTYNNTKPRNSNPSDLKSLFRPFNMNCMENVSILFADIVGFTKMSSNKSAEQLVGILNDLFEKFDYLCSMNNCEKISTLGDCYYCVSGCPEPRADHAVCCVEMGLGMIAAMAQFDQERHEGVTMRVGVHTGTVLCGIVGTRRFKFDVWSNDVTLANRMESTGRPEQVHVSEETSRFLGDAYLLEEGPEVCDHKTYFIKGRKSDFINSEYPSQTNLDLMETKSPPRFDSLQLIISPPSTPNSLQCNPLSTMLDHVNGNLKNSTPKSLSPNQTNVISNTVPNSINNHINNSLNGSLIDKSNYSFSSNSPNSPNTPNLSPNSQNVIGLGQSPILARNSPNFYRNSTQLSPNLSITSNLSPVSINMIPNSPNASPNSSPNPNRTSPNFIDTNFLSPNPFKVKASSLPSILDSDNENDDDEDTSTNNQSMMEKTERNKHRKTWKIPKFLRKNEINESKNIEEGKKIDDVSISTNGYQQLPIVIESNAADNNRLTVGSCAERRTIDTSSTNSTFDDIIDIRSYINQSRSDISPFARSSSYRSQYGRSPTTDVSPLARARSATVTTRGDAYAHHSVNSANTTSGSWALRVPGDDTHSISPSVGSRKDSGIRSNSRRSSIQQQIYVMNQQNTLTQSDILHHRVSGYYTSSQSSLDEPVTIRAVPVKSTVPVTDHLSSCFQKLRKQSDLQLIRCVQDNVNSQRSYFVKPPLRTFSLFFSSREMEKEYRAKAHRMGERDLETPPTLATSKFNTHIDVLVSAIIYLVVAISIFFLYPPHKVWVCVFMFFSSIQFFALFLCTRNICKPDIETRGYVCTDAVFELFSKWYPWHFCGGVLLTLPVLSVLINFWLFDGIKIHTNEFYFSYLLFICIIHFCNFTQLNYWMKNILVTVSAIFFIVIAVYNCPVQLHHHHLQNHINNAQNISVQYNFLKALASLHPKDTPANIYIPTNSTMYSINNSNTQYEPEINIASRNLVLENKTDFKSDLNSNTTNDMLHFKNITSVENSKPSLKMDHDLYHIEIYIDVLLILILVWFLNREFEISYRLSFHCNVVANKDKARVQSMKNQADWLLHNIIPKHVADQLKNTAKYSENHKNVGIIFASIVNFNEMYDESYLGGKEFLRVLNELIGDFDELLTKPEFKTVEKIKTIGSTFMAASGLDPYIRGGFKNEHTHLFQLMDFAIAMQNVIDNFNKDLLEFNLILRVGYNFGDVTAGVIGTSKLYYDIWGDAVNIASRMDSTGVKGRIQVGESCVQILSEKYEFEPRGSVYVKGKDNMNVFLLTKKTGDDFD